MISITTLDRKLARDMEPRASAPHRRLDTTRELARAGIPVIVSVAPVIPGLTDHEIESILEQAADAGAIRSHYSVLRLSHELAGLFKEWLAANDRIFAERSCRSYARHEAAGRTTAALGCACRARDRSPIC